MGAQIREADGEYGTVGAVQLVHRVQTMYNLEVAEAHTFFVGGEQWLVHNKCGNKPTGRRTTFTPGTKQALIARDGAMCLYCGSTKNLTIDHLIPWEQIKQGAPTRAEEIRRFRDFLNLALACRSCNSSKRDRDLIEWYVQKFYGSGP